jgi:RNA polymerase sigma factor (sigma-70 family)
VAQAFGEFYRREFEPAVRLAWLLLGEAGAAEDVVQNAMAAIFLRFEQIDVPAGYLRRAIVNGAQSWRRDERRQQQRAGLVARERLDVPRSDPRMLDAVARLPYRQRVVIVARYWGDWSEREIADALGCRPGTVKSLASRALSQLREEAG